MGPPCAGWTIAVRPMVQEGEEWRAMRQKLTALIEQHQAALASRDGLEQAGKEAREREHQKKTLVIQAMRKAKVRAVYTKSMVYTLETDMMTLAMVPAVPASSLNVEVEDV
jgi:seryl-tRNA synthetase